jgi:hypothetical protein
MAINLCRAAAASKRWKSRAQTRSHSDGYSVAPRFRTSGHARRRTSASYSGDRQKNQAGRMRILYCETIFHRDVPRNCARAIAAQTYFRTRRFPIKGSGEIHRRSNLHRATKVVLLVSGLCRVIWLPFWRMTSNPTFFSARTNSRALGRPEARQEWRLPLPGRGWARP